MSPVTADTSEKKGWAMWRDNQTIEAMLKESREDSRGTATERPLHRCFRRLDALSGEGFSAGLHIRFASPMIYVRTYDKAWLREYDENAYALRDPVVFWALAQKGAARWSEIRSRYPDPFKIFEKASRHGLNYGVSISHGPLTSRSIVGIARSDRELTTDEIEEAHALVRELHDAARPPMELTEAQAEALRLLAEGDRHTAAAAKLGISESAFKARLQSARVRLGARTTAQALKIAREYQLL